MTLLIFLSLMNLNAQDFDAQKEVGLKEEAVAIMQPKSGSKVKGKIHFAQMPDGVKVDYKIENLPKNKKFGFHVHEKGDCSSADGKSAGHHFLAISPTGGTSKTSPGKYAGDMPMLMSDDKGMAVGTFTQMEISLIKGLKNNIIDRAVVIHGGPDNPKKDSPPRIACGVVEPTSSSLTRK